MKRVKLWQIVKAGNAEHVFESLQACSSVQSYQGIEKELLTTAVATGNCQVWLNYLYPSEYAHTMKVDTWLLIQAHVFVTDFAHKFAYFN